MSYPDDNPKTIHGIKKPPLHLCSPVAMIQWAGAMGLGAHKYGPYNWREKTVSSSVYVAAAMRHLQAYWDGEDLDPESNAAHLGHAMACCSIIMDAASIGKLNDDRPLPGKAGEVQRDWEKRSEQPSTQRILDDVMAVVREPQFRAVTLSVGDRVEHDYEHKQGTIFKLRTALTPHTIGVRWDRHGYTPEACDWHKRDDLILLPKMSDVEK